MALGKNHWSVGERWTGWDANNSAKRSYFFFWGFYFIGWSFSIAVFNACNPVSLYFSVVSGLLCPAKCCTILRSLFLANRLVITLCLMVVAVSFFLNWF